MEEKENDLLGNPTKNPLENADLDEYGNSARLSDKLEKKFLVWWKEPKHKLWTFRVILFIANFLLLLGIFIFMWLNFAQ